MKGKDVHMIERKTLIIVMPAYNAERTLRRTYDEIPHDLVDEIVLVDDASWDNTAEIAQSLSIRR